MPPTKQIRPHEGVINWAVLSDEQMSNGLPFSLLNDEQMSNKMRVEQQSVDHHCPIRALFLGGWRRYPYIDSHDHMLFPIGEVLPESVLTAGWRVGADG